MSAPVADVAAAFPAVIDRFAGRWAALSNFAVCDVELDGELYPSSEHAFNAGKTLDPDERAVVRSKSTGAKAKAAGQQVTLRPNWSEKVRYEVMAQALTSKFTNPRMREVLLATGDALLIEGTTTWCDQHWGCCSCKTHRSWPGQNHLGRLLMAERARVRGDSPDRWRRVAVTGHRPQHMTPLQRDFARAELDRLAVKMRDDHGMMHGIAGMALGADTWWAESVLRAGTALWAYVPFSVQAAKWPREDQDTWRDLMNRASRRVILAEGYDVRLLHARNDAMIRDADVIIAVHDPDKSTGGTASAVRKASACGKTIVSVNIAAGRTSIRRPVGARDSSRL